MKRIFFIGLMVLTACGRLTDEQRKRLKDGMKKSEIRKVTDAQLTDAAFAAGQAITSQWTSINDVSLKESLEKKYQTHLVILRSGSSVSNDIERQILEAYATGSGGPLNDNVQKMGADSLLYTRPVMRNLPDGSQHFNYAIGAHLSKKQIVLQMKD